MPITDDQTRDLAALRQAAHQREWMTNQDTLKRLLAALDPLLALSVAAEPVQAFLPTFEAYFPQAGWLRELLLTVVSYASAPGDLPEAAVNQFPQPGCGNYVKAVLDLARAVQDKYTAFERYSHTTNAIANAILAELTHTYFSAHPDQFAALSDPNTDADTRARIQYAFWLDPVVAERDTALWLSVADTLTARLNGQ